MAFQFRRAGAYYSFFVFDKNNKEEVTAEHCIATIQREAHCSRGSASSEWDIIQDHIMEEVPLDSLRAKALRLSNAKLFAATRAVMDNFTFEIKPWGGSHSD